MSASRKATAWCSKMILPKLSSLLRVGEGDLVGGARHAERLRRDADASALEIGERDTVAVAFLAEPVFDRHMEVFETDGAGVRRVLPHLVLDPADAIAGPVGLDDEAADAVLAPWPDR